jgi:hypothetical protein
MVGERTKDNSAQIAAKAKETLRTYSDRSMRELQLLAEFYHKHGYLKEAAEIRQAIANLRQHSNRAGNTKLAEDQEPKR